MSGTFSSGAAPWGTLDTAPPGPLPAYQLAVDTGVLFLAAEIELYLPGAASQTSPGEAWGVPAWGALTQTAVPIADFTTLRVSDVGWVTSATDPGGVQPYPPLLLSGIALDRSMQLAPDGQGAAASWGELRLANDADALTSLAASRNVDGRPITIRLGRKPTLPHGVLREVALAETSQLAGGLGAGLRLDDDGLAIALRDAGYWMDRPADATLYAGLGGLEGSATLAGTAKPKLRGGTLGDPVREIAPVLVDATAGIYQVSDAPGGIVTLYERGLSGGITFGGAVADITVTVPAAGTYRTESSARGLFLRLGTFPPAGQITVDAWGAFPDGTAPSTAADVALQLMRQDLSVPAAALDSSSFTGLAAAAPWTAGIWTGDAALDGIGLVGLLMRSVGARLVPRRSGQLAAVALRALGSGNLPVASYTTAQIIACTPRALGSPLDPPPFRIRVGHQRFHTIQTSDLAPTLSGTRRQALAEPWRVAAASSAEVLASWRRPSDPQLVETALTNAAHAQVLADALRDLWCIAGGRRLYDVTLSLGYALRHDIGEILRLTYPGLLAAGAQGRIIGEQLRTDDGIAILQVLI